MAGNRGLRSQLTAALAELQTLRSEMSLNRAERADSSDHEINADSASSNTIVLGINEIKVLIPEFNPQHPDSLSASMWLKNIEKFKNIYRWTEQTVLLYSTLRLAGPARYWYNSMEKELNKWEAFKVEFLKSFPSSNDDGEILFKIMTRKKRNDECIENYFYEILGLSKRIKLSNESTMKYIISGLSNDHLKGVLLASNCQTLESLLNQIKKFEEMERQTINRDKISHLN